MSDIAVKDSFTAMVHALHVREDDVNAVIVKEKLCEQLEDGTFKYTDKLKIYDNPVRPYWITKPEHRCHKYKKEYETIDKLDMYTVRDSLMISSIKNTLNNYTRKVKQLFDSPYIYGADIESAVLLKHRYRKDIKPHIPIKYTVGGLDIENEIYGDERILLITFIHEKEIYTAALQEYMVVKDPDGDSRMATSTDVYAAAKELIGGTLESDGYTLSFYIADGEVDLIKWIFDKIHKCKTDFIGAWNMRHDIPHILKRLGALGVDARDVMCHPEIPKDLRIVDYYVDNNKNLQHFTDRWDWFNCSGYSQFIDAMCLYSRIRKTSGRKSSYSLDNVSKEELGVGKLELGPLGDHTYEQKNHFVRYTIYNIVDTLRMQQMEFKNKDYRQLMSLVGVSMLKDFNKQMVMVKNNTFFHEFELKRIIATSGSTMYTEYDTILPKAGGAVLNPNRTLDIGVRIIIEAPDIETKVCMCVNDLDVRAEYPSIISTFNIAKQTKCSTAVEIHGYPVSSVEQYFANIVSPIENAAWMCNVFYGLPNYTEMEELFNQYLIHRLKDRLPTDLDMVDEDNIKLVDKYISHVIAVQ